MARRDADDQSRSGAKSVAELLREAGHTDGGRSRRRADEARAYSGLPPDPSGHDDGEAQERAAQLAAAEALAQQETQERVRRAAEGLARRDADQQARLAADQAAQLRTRELASAAERTEAERRAAERVAAAQRLKAERLKAERLEAERLKAERLEAGRLEAERLEAERLDAVRRESERREAQQREAQQREAEIRARREAEEQAVRDTAILAEHDRRVRIEGQRRARLSELGKADDRAPSWFTLSEFADQIGTGRGSEQDRPLAAPRVTAALDDAIAASLAQPRMPVDRPDPVAAAPPTAEPLIAPVQTRVASPARPVAGGRPETVRPAAAAPVPTPARARTWPPDDSADTPAWLSQGLTDLTVPLPAVPATQDPAGPATDAIGPQALGRVGTATSGVAPAPPGPAHSGTATTPGSDGTAPTDEPAPAARPPMMHWLLAVGELILAVALGLGLSYVYRLLWDFTPYVAAVAAPVAVCGLVGTVGWVRKRLGLGAVPLGLLLVILFVATLLVVLPAAWVISP